MFLLSSSTMLTKFRYVRLGAHFKGKIGPFEQVIKIAKNIPYENSRANKGPKERGSWIRKNGGIIGDYDILVLERNAIFNLNVRTICLQDPEFIPPSNLFVSGWGLTSLTGNILSGKYQADQKSSSDIPKVIQVESLTKYRCKFNRFSKGCKYCEEKYTFCAAGTELINSSVIEDSCQGDSGGNIKCISKRQMSPINEN